MDSDTEAPILHFFRSRPHGLEKQPPLASSLQSFETALFLIALNRLPSALVACASAWESAIKAKLQVEPEERATLESLLESVRCKSPALNAFKQRSLDRFRKARNRIVHYGFSPMDDKECAVLLLESGFPFLKELFRASFDFYLDWKDINPKLTSLTELEPQDAAKVGLMPDLAAQVRIAIETFRVSKNHRGSDPSHCFLMLAHWIRHGLKENQLTSSQLEMLDHGASVGRQHELQAKQIVDLERIFNYVTWEFDCPSCEGAKTVVAELDELSLRKKIVRPKRFVCVECELIVPSEAAFLAEVALGAQINDLQREIIDGYHM